MHNLYSTIMFTDTPPRHKPVLFHRKAYSNCLEETYYNHRNYLALLSHFSDNLIASMKNFQECIYDLEEYPKFKISRSEKQVLDCGLEQLWQQYLQRLCKESYYRNALIRKDYNLFVENYYAKHKKTQYPKVKVFTIKSFSQKQRISQRSSFNKESFSRPSSIYQKKQLRRPLLLSKPMLYQLDFITRVEKHSFQGSKILSVRKTGKNQFKHISNSTRAERKNSDLDIKGNFVFASQSKGKEESESHLQKITKNPEHSMSYNKVAQFRNRMSTNPEQYQKQRALKCSPLLRMSYMNIQRNSMSNKVELTKYQQQIKIILNIDK